VRIKYYLEERSKDKSREIEEIRWHFYIAISSSSSSFSIIHTRNTHMITYALYIAQVTRSLPRFSRVWRSNINNARGFAIPRSATRVKRNTMQSGHAIQRATAMREERAFVPSPFAALSRFCSSSHCIKRLQFATAKMLIPSLEISSGS